MCFEILGMDVILDYKLKPWLLEVNHTPSFTTDSKIDEHIKYNLINDTINLLNINANDKQIYANKQVFYYYSLKEEFVRRLFPKKQNCFNKDDRYQKIRECMRERDEFDFQNMGNFINAMDEKSTRNLKEHLDYAL